MNKIARTFIFVGLVVVILLAMHLLPTLNVGDTELRHVNILSDVLPEVYQQRDGIDVIPKPEPPKPIVPRATATTGLTDTSVSGSQPATKVQLDTTAAMPVVSSDLIADYSEGKAGGLAHFYHKLAHPSSDRPVRIAYYGDSFIEGDILTGDLRELLQSRFGGSGVGWVDCDDHLKGFRQTVKRKAVGFTAHEVVKKPFNHQCEGIAQRYFVPGENSRLWITGVKAKKHLDTWQQAIFYFRTEEGFTVTPYVNGDTLPDEHIAGSTAVQKLAHTRSAMHSTGYRLNDIGHATYVYGVALESKQGVVLDNFSMRGSAGYTLAKIPLQTLHEFAQLRPYDLIILHFGLNVANEKAHAANYKAYISRMQQAVEHLRAAFPEASVLIVSMPDRDQRTDAGIRTINGVESLVAYQQILASNCHVAYFNLFSAMGGRESMKRMVDKGLANKDYTHLTFNGGRHIAKIIYDGLMEAYGQYNSAN